MDLLYKIADYIRKHPDYAAAAAVGALGIAAFLISPSDVPAAKKPDISTVVSHEEEDREWARQQAERRKFVVENYRFR